MAFERLFQNMNRRTFLKAASLTGIAGLASPRDVFAALAPSQLSRVVIVEDGTATSGLSINAGAVQVMVNSGIQSLTGLRDIGEAWKTIFPGINTSKVIAIKVNCINPNMPTHPEVSYAVAESLKKMSFGGVLFPENNIVIFDRNTTEMRLSGYTINTSGTGIRCYSTSGNYSDESYNVNGVNLRISRILTDEADYLINISVLKNHTNPGVTLCLKNHYGTNNSPGLMHGNNCDPYIPALNTVPPIADKQCLCICDALLGIATGGAGGYPQFAANTIIVSKDIVAVDYWGREILDANGCNTIAYAHHIDTAASVPYNLGTNDPAQMDVVNVLNPTAVEESTWGSVKNLFRKK